jgi:hypothetical protein
MAIRFGVVLGDLSIVTVCGKVDGTAFTVTPICCRSDCSSRKASACSNVSGS